MICSGDHSSDGRKNEKELSQSKEKNLIERNGRYLRIQSPTLSGSYDDIYLNDEQGFIKVGLNTGCKTMHFSPAKVCAIVCMPLIFGLPRYSTVFLKNRV